MPNYGDPQYWDKRYKDNENSTFDWLEDYASLKPLFSELIPDKNARIIILGCGNAPLSEDMYDDGYELIHNIDISSVVIRQMRERNKEKVKMTYEVTDCTDMKSIPDCFFDVAIDKSTIDALLCGDNAYLNVAKMTKEIQRVIKTDGLYIAISYGKPESRAIHFERDHLKFANKQFILYPVDCKEEEKEEKSHYIYISRKLEGAELVCAHNWEKVVDQLHKEALEEAQNLDEDSEGSDQGSEKGENDQINEKTSKSQELGITKKGHARSLSS